MLWITLIFCAHNPVEMLGWWSVKRAVIEMAENISPLTEKSFHGWKCLCWLLLAEKLFCLHIIFLIFIPQKIACKSIHGFPLWHHVCLWKISHITVVLHHNDFYHHCPITFSTNCSCNNDSAITTLTATSPVMVIPLGGFPPWWIAIPESKEENI